MQNRTDSGTPHFSISQPNMDVSFHDIEIEVSICTNYEIKSLDFPFIPNILGFPSIIWADKWEWVYEVS